MAADNRLTAEQLAALQPGDVTIDSGHEFIRPRYATGEVVRVGTTHVIVCCDGAKGVRYVEQLRLRDGLRDGRGRAEFVRSDQAPRQGPARHPAQPGPLPAWAASPRRS